MHPNHPYASIPPDTVKKANAIMGRDNFFIKLGDSWESLFAETPFFKGEEREASQKWMVPSLAIGTLLQYKENLSDRQAEEASRLRVDWKYALHLSMYYPGLTLKMLCKYRQRVYHNPSWQEEFQSVLERFIQHGFFQEPQEAPLTALALLDEVCSRSRLERVMQAQTRALEALATNYTKWLREVILPQWYSRYHLFMAEPDLPHSAAGQSALAEIIGADILYLLKTISLDSQADLAEIEEIKALQQIWLEQFELAGDGKARCLSRCSFCGSLNAFGKIGG